jgi:uncharacterized membrane protein
MSDEDRENDRHHHRAREARRAAAWADRLAQPTTALTVIVVADVAATISDAHIVATTRCTTERRCDTYSE